jgi:hypothetical protein
MRVTIIKSDKTVSVDGDPRVIDALIDLPGISAVQWYDDYGEIEYEGHSQPNRRFFDLAPYQRFIDAHAAAKARDEAAEAERRRQLEEALAAERRANGQAD